MQRILIITDLDNTLYDWVTFYALAFDAMIDKLCEILGVGKETLIREFKGVHQRYGNSEQPFAALELPCVRRRFQGMKRNEIATGLDEAFHAFNRERKKHLRLYPYVYETLCELQKNGVTIVGHTEAYVVNAYHRIEMLGLRLLLRQLYASEGKDSDYPYSERGQKFPIPGDFVHTLPRSKRKPNPDVLRGICTMEGFEPRDTWYVGDSLARDISMAKMAGATGVWAQYGTTYDRRLWDILVQITHWTQQDVAREGRLRDLYSNVQPDFTICGFHELLALLGLPPLPNISEESSTPQLAPTAMR